MPDDDPRLRPTHTIDTKERRQLRREIVEQALSTAHATQDNPPTLYLAGGGSAAGKGTLLNAFKAEGFIPDDAVEIDPDRIKESLPEYRELNELGDSRSADVVHEESKAIAREILKGTFAKRCNIVLDRTLANKKAAEQLVAEAKTAGYRVVLAGITVEVETAVQRAPGLAATIVMCRLQP